MTYIDKKKFERIMTERFQTVTSISEATGVSPTTIRDMKNGKRKPRPETLRKVTEFLKCTPGDILED